jgi:uncharacterized protein YndB with AHSA1/START domain
MPKKVKLSDHYGSFNKTGDIYEIRFERKLSHPVKQVWQAITDPAKLALWLGSAEVDLKVEGEIRIRFQDMDVVGQILQFKNENLLEYTWTSQSFAGEISIVRFELFPEGKSGCRLVFTERLVSAPYLTGAGSGWHYILDMLSMVLDHLQIPEWSDELRMEIFEELGPQYRKIADEKAAGKNATQPMAKAEMLIRKPVEEVFEAMVSPDITSRFWYTKGSARLDSGKNVRWEWEMYGASVELCAHEIQKNKFIAFNWPSEGGTTSVEMSFTPRGRDATFLSITEKGWDAADEKMPAYVAGQTEGWTMVLAALKALLEFNLVLPLVADRFPAGVGASADAN